MKHLSNTILTDQDPWLTEAIIKELPRIKRGLCVWHITAKFSVWFTAIIHGKYYNWRDDFYRLYRLETITEFEHEGPLV